MMTKSTREHIIRLLDLQPHPEGGYYAETYRCDEFLAAGHLPARYGGDRSMSTAIYYLLSAEFFSAFHRIKSDEVWHFYLGAPVHLLCLDQEGNLHEHLLGNDFSAGQRAQLVVKAGDWFAAFIAETGAWSLVGCTVAPGFDFSDFEMGHQQDLLSRYPRHADMIRKYSKS